MTESSIEEEGRRRVEELREARAAARERLDSLDAERRALLHELVGAGISVAKLARWERVTSWAVGQALRKAEPSASRAGASATLSPR